MKRSTKENKVAALKRKLKYFTVNSGGYKFDRSDANNYENRNCTVSLSTEQINLLEKERELHVMNKSKSYNKGESKRKVRNQ